MAMTAEKFIAKKESQFNKERDKKITTRDVGGEKCCFVRESWVFMSGSEHSDRVFSLEKFRIAEKEREGEIVYRVGYFIVGEKDDVPVKVMPKDGKFIFEGHCPLMTKEEFKKLLKEGIRKGIITPDMILASPF